MSRESDEASLAVQHAREALRDNRQSDARQWAERAAQLAPDLEDPWLVLAAVASPAQSVEYIQRALQINPDSPRARKGMQWAIQRLNAAEAQPPLAETQESLVSRLPTVRSEAVVDAPAALAPAPAPSPRLRPALPYLLLGIGLLICMVAGLSAAMSPVLASLLHPAGAARQPSWALASIPKPTHTPRSPLAYDIEPTLAPDVTEPAEALATPQAETSTLEPNLGYTGDMATPTLVGQQPPTEEQPTAEPTYSGTLSMEFVDEAPVPVPTPGYSASGGQHWIDVDLSQQRLYAYEGDTVVNSFLVSTGTWLHPTVTGKYRVYVKLRYTDMSGADYYLPNVPYTMYFYQGYGVHGTYWHHNFGTPMSHGCVNLSIPDSEWLYNFSSVGTVVNIHY